jgi:hypothetical protein
VGPTKKESKMNLYGWNTCRATALAAVMAGGMLMPATAVLAQAASPDAGSPDTRDHNSLEGTWRAQLTVRDCQTGAVLRTFPAMFAFAQGGTLTVTTAGQLPSQSTAGLGVWRHTDGRRYSAVSEAFLFSPAGVWTGTQRLTRVIEIDNDANAFTDAVGVQILDTNRKVIVTGCGTTVGRRFK